MALNVGEHFKQRWLNTPEAVRQTYCDELKFICNLLEPDTLIHKWQSQEVLLQQRNHQITERAYKQLKQELLAEQKRRAEELKRQRQAELEQALAAKRAQQQAILAAQEQQEKVREQQQTEFLRQLAAELHQQSLQHASASIAKFDVSQVKQYQHANAETSFPHAKVPADDQSLSVDPTDTVPQATDLKIRLELEAEYYIEHTLAQLKCTLQAAAQEEIALILAQHQP